MSDEKNLEHAGEGNPEELESLKIWWNNHGGVVATVLCVVLAAVIAFNLYTRHSKAKAEEASMKYSSANSAAALESLVAGYRGSPVAALAKLRLGNEYYNNGQFELARSSFGSFMAENPKHDLVPVAEIGLAHVDEADGKFGDAEKRFADFQKARPDHFLVPSAKLGEARCLIFEGRKDEARSKLDRMMAEFAGTPWANYADELLSAVPRLKFIAPAAPSFSDALEALAGQDVTAGTNTAVEEAAAGTNDVSAAEAETNAVPAE